jgi:hypothetical protein
MSKMMPVGNDRLHGLIEAAPLYLPRRTATPRKEVVIIAEVQVKIQSEQLVSMSQKQ